MTDVAASKLVLEVMEMGRLSNEGKQYCYLTAFSANGNEYHVVTDLRKQSDSFIVYTATTSESNDKYIKSINKTK